MSDRERLKCPGCGLEYWWPGGAWKHDRCDKGGDEPKVVKQAEADPQVAEPARTAGTSPPETPAAAPKFDRKAVMKARWAARKAQGKTGL